MKVLSKGSYISSHRRVLTCFLNNKRWCMYLSNCDKTALITSVDIAQPTEIFDALLFKCPHEWLNLPAYCTVLYYIELCSGWATVYCKHASQSCMACAQLKGTLVNVLQLWHKPWPRSYCKKRKKIHWHRWLIHEWLTALLMLKETIYGRDCEDVMNVI